MLRAWPRCSCRAQVLSVLLSCAQVLLLSGISCCVAQLQCNSRIQMQVAVHLYGAAHAGDVYAVGPAAPAAASDRTQRVCAVQAVQLFSRLTWVTGQLM